MIASLPEDQMDDVADRAAARPCAINCLPAATPDMRRKLMLLTAPQQLVAFDL